MESCDSATPCPSGTNAGKLFSSQSNKSSSFQYSQFTDCPAGEQCFANTPCAPAESAVSVSATTNLDFSSMVSIPPYCGDQDTMRRNVGYWQVRTFSHNIFIVTDIRHSTSSHIISFTFPPYRAGVFIGMNLAIYSLLNQ